MTNAWGVGLRGFLGVITQIHILLIPERGQLQDETP
jgi:hypothetical protein